MHNGLKRATIRQERYHNDNQFDRLAQACKHRALLGTEGFAATLTAIARAFAAVDHAIALPRLSSCLALQMGANLAGSIHWLCLVLHTYSIADGRFFFKLLGLLSTS